MIGQLDGERAHNDFFDKLHRDWYSPPFENPEQLRIDTHEVPGYDEAFMMQEMWDAFRHQLRTPGFEYLDVPGQEFHRPYVSEGHYVQSMDNVMSAMSHIIHFRAMRWDDAQPEPIGKTILQVDPRGYIGEVLKGDAIFDLDMRASVGADWFDEIESLESELVQPNAYRQIPLQIHPKLAEIFFAIAHRAGDMMLYDLQRTRTSGDRHDQPSIHDLENFAAHTNLNTKPSYRQMRVLVAESKARQQVSEWLAAHWQPRFLETATFERHIIHLSTRLARDYVAIEGIFEPEQIGKPADVAAVERSYEDILDLCPAPVLDDTLLVGRRRSYHLLHSLASAIAGTSIARIRTESAIQDLNHPTMQKPKEWNKGE